MSPEELKDWREAHGLTIAGVAERLPCGERTWAHWEGGTRTPPDFLPRALRDLERELAMERAPRARRTSAALLGS